VSIFLLLSFGLSSTPVQAKTYYLSVNVNDWAEYSMSVSSGGYSTSGKIKYVIVSKAVPGGEYNVSGNPMEVAYCDVYANGQKVLSANPSNFDSTSGVDTTGPFFPAGEEFWADYKSYLAIASPTVSVSIGGSSVSLDVTASNSTVTASLHLEVDKGTGALTYLVLDGSVGQTSVHMTMSLTGTSLPVPNPIVIVLAIGITAAVVVLVALLLYRTRRKRAAITTASTAEAQPPETGDSPVTQEVNHGLA
jgi:hypothetical protein